jgi:hypothetical protein
MDLLFAASAKQVCSQQSNRGRTAQCLPGLSARCPLQALSHWFDLECGSWLGSLATARMKSKPFKMHKPINSIISMFTRMTTAFCIIFTSKHRRFYPHKPWTAVQFVFGLEVELYFYTCWSSDAWTKGSRSPKKLAWNLMMSIGHFVGLFLDLVTNVSRSA